MIAAIVQTSPLAGCRAHLFARTPGQLRTLEELATKTGFQSVMEGDPLTHSDQRSVAYYLFHALVGDPLLGQILGAIRSSPDPTVRFAPAIVVVGDCRMSDVIRFVGQGFDDIIALPEKAAKLERRFATQVNIPITYYETSEYFGPDRRRLRRPGRAADEQQGPGVFQHRRYIIRRTPRIGVQILARELVTTGASRGGESGMASPFESVQLFE